MFESEKVKSRRRIITELVLAAISIIGALLTKSEIDARNKRQDPFFNMSEREKKQFKKRSEKWRNLRTDPLTLPPPKVLVEDNLYPPCNDTEIKIVSYMAKIIEYKNHVGFDDWGTGEPEPTDNVIVELKEPADYIERKVTLQFPSAEKANWNKVGHLFRADAEQNRYALFCGFEQCLSNNECLMGAPRKPKWLNAAQDTSDL